MPKTMTGSVIKLEFLIVESILFVLFISSSLSANDSTSGILTCGKKQCHFLKTTQSIFVDRNTVSKYKATYTCNSENEELKALLTCNSGDYTLNVKELTCFNGSWVPQAPHNCSLKQPMSKTFFEKNKWVIIGGGSGGFVFLILIIVVVAVVVLRRKRRMRKMKEALQADIDGMLNPGYGMGSVYSFTGLERRGYHKVWSCKRTKKKFIYGETLNSLLDAAMERFGYTEKVRLVLEEDGTEVDNDEILNACAGKVFLILSKNEKWMNPLKTSATDNENRMTFDVCSYNRRIRNLILANTLKDLIHQGSTLVNYTVTTVCLEEDGTTIDDTESLFACVSKTFMLLGRDHEWMASQEPMSPVSKDEMNRNSRLSQSLSYMEDRAMYKVWTQDGDQRKVVFADNVIDLHLKASRALGLEIPVKVTIHGTDEEIIEDDKLLQNKDKILDVSSVGSDTGSNEYFIIEKSQRSSESMSYTANKPSGSRHLDEAYYKSHDAMGQNRNNDKLTPEEPRYVHHDRPPGGTTTPGYRMFESSDVSLRHINHAPHEINTPPEAYRNQEMNLPYTDLSPSHHAHPGRLRNEEIEMNQMGYNNKTKRENYNNVLNRNDRSNSYSQDVDIQLSGRPYLVTGDTPQSRKSDVLF